MPHAGRFTEEQARAIFAEAAERQHEARLDGERLSLKELQEIGAAAGLDPAFVARAAADVLRPDRRPVRKSFAGMPVELRATRVIPGPVDDALWAQIVQELRTTFRRDGIPTELGPTREWVSAAGPRGRHGESNEVRVVVEPEGDGARVTIAQTLWPQVLGLSIGTATTLGMGLLMGVLWLALSPGGDQWVPALALTLFGLVFGAAAYAGTRRQGQKQQRRFRDTLARIERLAEGAAPLPVPEDEQADRDRAAAPAAGADRAAPALTLEDEAPDSRAPASGTRTRA